VKEGGLHAAQFGFGPGKELSLRDVVGQIVGQAGAGIGEVAFVADESQLGARVGGADRLGG
jgi:hypothetical protein